ncbi:cation diffusion facilitator family transporter [Magnetococcus marinus MC-1]|uniref:Cation diffusion facilitator family transporter n=1 Tax=Magnetococcus marinus (strain ATCC BAA-1437 / JCM 17883 / MC-1) TaxID=156889 RepID=A0L9V8_MAGMM|nr:magnetosome biogenesis CDF transporter MamB [Magnetococcus marinus]ABK44751.1 cation diffusion facilitator family transporter [Magnetococcus marinus MC-1]
MKYDECRNCRDTVTWYSIVSNLILVVIKGVLGVISGCQALVADAFHSSADVMASTVTLASLKISERPADDDHHYGHGKVQFISSSIVGLILITGAIFILIDAIKTIVTGDYDAPNRIAILGAAISVISNELMFRYQSCVGKQNNSPAIMANAWDNRSDAFSSIAVMIGVAFATFGFPVADPLAALGVSVLVIRIGIELNLEAIDGLMDASPEMEELEDIYKIVKDVSSVHGINYMRARTMGDNLHVELNVEVAEALKVYEGDLIVDLLKRRIFQEVKHIGELQIFLTPLRTESR